MKKIIWKIVIALIIIVLFIAIRPIRTKSIIRSIAENEFINELKKDSLRKQLYGPIISEKEKYSEFKWYKVLEWGDTAAIYIDVYKNPFDNNWGNFLFPRITMNYQWYYFLFPNGTSKFEDILPIQYEKRAIKSSDFKLYTKNEIADSIRFIVKPDRLFYFLQKGYFSVIEKNENYTIVDYYEPIANVVHKHKNDVTSTMSAKVFVNDSLEVLIIPYDIPIEIRNKK